MSVKRPANPKRRLNIHSHLCVEPLEARAMLTAVAPPSGLISWWTADDTAADWNGLNDGTIANGADYAVGQVADGFIFDGIDDHFTAPTAGFPIGNADRTVELWARIDRHVAEEATFFSYGEPGVYSKSFGMGTRDDGRLFVSTWIPALFGPVLDVGRWHHVAATNVGRSFALYLNGVRVASSLMDVDTAAGSTAWMGRVTMSTIGDIRRHSGMVDEVTVYNRALDDSEIQSIYNAGSDGKIKGSAPSTVAIPRDINGIYVWDIDIHPGIHDGQADLRISALVRRDSDGDGLADDTDAIVPGAWLYLLVSGGSGRECSGFTDEQGEFLSDWLGPLPAARYTAEVWWLSHYQLYWKDALDPTALDADENLNGRPEQPFMISDDLELLLGVAFQPNNPFQSIHHRVIAAAVEF